MTETGNWGRWGTEDQRGALNLIDGPTVLAAAGRLKSGKVYSLAIPIGHFDGGSPLIRNTSSGKCWWRYSAG